MSSLCEVNYNILLSWTKLGEQENECFIHDPRDESDILNE